jgi:hypothetical protein
MDGYMRENKIEEIKPDFPMKPPPGTGRPLESAESTAESTRPAANAEAATANPAQEAKTAETATAQKTRPAPAR